MRKSFAVSAPVSVHRRRLRPACGPRYIPCPPEQQAAITAPTSGSDDNDGFSKWLPSPGFVIYYDQSVCEEERSHGNRTDRH